MRKQEVEGLAVMSAAKPDTAALQTAIFNSANFSSGCWRSWNGRFIFEKKVTHILVLSDSPGRDHEVNRQLEAELKEIEARFLITVYGR
ncbi:MAG: hypothetical protein EXR92_05625 [Gemmatimonadetes bacterium]|nr:hypothetical protein [Gemmatimonadota bacterium]